MEFIFLQVGNNPKRYVAKEELYNEAEKYMNKNIYMSDLIDAINNVKTKCKDEVIMIVRKFLHIWRCCSFISRG